jgi:hypothetical protein
MKNQYNPVRFDIQQNDTQHKDTEHNIQHKGLFATLSINDIQHKIHSA